MRTETNLAVGKVAMRQPDSNCPASLHRLNQTIAKLRADLARLGRQTWSASKTPAALADHLAIYIALNNGYAVT